MIVARSKDKEEEEERKSKKVPYSSLEEKDKKMNSFPVLCTTLLHGVHDSCGI